MINTAFPTVKHFSLDEYNRLEALGFFLESKRVELIHGQIIEMAAEGTAHSVCSTRLNRELFKILGERATLRGQEPIVIPPDSAPEPDFAIVRNHSDDYLSAHPSPSDVFWVVEISDSTLNYDQQVKLALYAEAGISDYWIINLQDKHLEVYSDPYRNPQGNSSYRMKRIFLANEAIILPYFPELSLNLINVFPEC
jgi:Uma2 family endonuclease